MHIRDELQFVVYVLEETLELLEETDRTCTRLTNTQLDQKARYAKTSPQLRADVFDVRIASAPTI
jgi:hypothetical protein